MKQTKHIAKSYISQILVTITLAVLLAIGLSLCGESAYATDDVSSPELIYLDADTKQEEWSASGEESSSVNDNQQTDSSTLITDSIGNVLNTFRQVTDEQGNPVAGVYVDQDGNTLRQVTDEYGNPVEGEYEYVLNTSNDETKPYIEAEIVTGKDAYDQSEIVSPASMDTETVKVSTTDLEIPEASRTIINERISNSLDSETSGLQAIVDQAISQAAATAKEVVIELDKIAGDYSGDPVLISQDGHSNIETVILKTKSSSSEKATIDCAIATEDSILVKFINLLFGYDCIIQAEGGSTVQIGEENNLATGDIKVIAGESDTSSGTVNIYAGNGAAVSANIVNGTVTVYESRPNTTAPNDPYAHHSVTFSDNRTVSVNSNATAEDQRNICKINIVGRDTVNIKAINAWDTLAIVSGTKVNVLKRADNRINEVYNLSITASSENRNIYDLSQKLNLPNILKSFGVNSALRVTVPVDNTQVNIYESIKSLRNLQVYSYLVQEGYLLDTLIGNIACNIKIGSTAITVYEGLTLEAGLDLILSASSRATAGIDQHGNSLDGSLPISFNIFIENASINLSQAYDETASAKAVTTYKAGRHFEAKASSKVGAGASAIFDSLMAGLAFNVVINESSVLAVGCNITSSDGNVTLDSNANTTAAADARRSRNNKSADGMYFATNVVKQNSKTFIGDDTKITALCATAADKSGNVYINSTSNVDVTDDAIASGVIASDVNEEKTTVKKVFKEALNYVITKIGTNVLLSDSVLGSLFDARGFLRNNDTGKKIAGKLNGWKDSALNKMLGVASLVGEYNFVVEIDSTAQEKGTVKTSANSNNLEITVTSNNRINKVLVRYLLPGTDEYTFAEANRVSADSDKFTLDITTLKDALTLKEFRIYVFYGEEKTAAELKERKVNANTTDDDTINLEEFFNIAVQSTTDDQDADKNCGGNIKISFDIVGPDSTKNYGIIVLDDMREEVSAATTALRSLLGVAAGKNVRLNVNPSTIGKIKKITYSYTDTAGNLIGGNGEKVIQANNNGHFILTVPDNVQLTTSGGETTGTITIKAEFEEKTSTEKAEIQKPASNQITGSLGVTVVVNTNSAEMDASNNLTANIEADGKVEFNANANTNIRGKADGTAATEGQSGQIKVDDKTEKQNVHETVAASDSTNLVIYGVSNKDTTLGRNASTITLEGTVYTISLSPDSTMGYSLPGSIDLLAYTMDGVEHKITVEKNKDDDLYVIDMSKVDFAKDKYTDKTQESTKILKSKSFVATYGLAQYSISAEVQKIEKTDTKVHGTVTVNTNTVHGKSEIYGTITPETGYIVQGVILTYKDADGKTQKYAETRTTNHDYKFILPENSILSAYQADSLKILALVEKATDSKKVTISIADEYADYIKVDKTTACVGETVTISGINCKLLKDKLQVFSSGAAELEVSDSFTFVVTDSCLSGDIRTITVFAKTNYKQDYSTPITVTQASNGKIAVQNKKSDNTSVGKTGSGDVLYLKITPDTLYSLKNGTLVGKYTVGGVEKTILAERVSASEYKMRISEDIEASSGLNITAEFIQTERKYSAGVAVAVNVAVHKNTALITSGVILSKKGLTVNATTNGNVTTEALAGYSHGQTGIAGAIAVSVANYSTSAYITPGVIIGGQDNSKSEININARHNGGFNTSADAAKINAVSGKTGVGTGIAVAVKSVDTYAAIPDGVILYFSDPIKSINISSSNSIGNDSVNSKAGSKANDTAVTPVIALNIITSKSNAFLGQVKAFSLNSGLADWNALKLTVQSNNFANHNMNLDASAAGANCAMGGAFGINISKDYSKALLYSNIKGSLTDVLVKSTGDSNVTANVKSSVTGTKEGKKQADDSKGSADQKADNLINSGAQLAAGAGAGITSGTADLTKNRQSAQTSEGAVAGAAAFVLNVQKNETEAIIEDGTNIGGKGSEQAGNISVESYGHTAANIKADASATSKAKVAVASTIGIGVGVAINIVNSRNTAYLGKGTTNGGNVLVVATLVRDNPEKINEFKTSSISGAGANSKAIAGSVALAVLNNDTSARIVKDENDTFSSTNTTITAKDIRKAETTASAKATDSGDPDKNKTNSAYTLIDTDTSYENAGSIGAGASFAMVYGDNNIIAEFIAPKNATLSGRLVVTATSEHHEDTTSVAGSDPYAALFDPKTYKFDSPQVQIAADATVAINAVISNITANVAAPMNSAGTAQRYVPTVRAYTVRINAKEKGKSKTESSSYAMGSSSAVGGSVAVNLNKSQVTASNECCLMVSGDDYSDNDSEDPYSHTSVEINAVSEVTEENYAYACASGTDVLRIVEKYKGYLTQAGYLQEAVLDAVTLAAFIKNLLDGTYFTACVGLADKAISIWNNQLTEVIKNIKNTGYAKQDLGGYFDKIINSGNTLYKKIKELIPKVKDFGNMCMSVGHALMFMMDIKTSSTSKMDTTTGKATSQANSGINGSGTSGTQIDNNANANKQEESMQIAAAIGVAVSRHEVTAQSLGEIISTKGGVTVLAYTENNAAAHSTGAATSGNAGVGSIALAIAVKYDENKITAKAAKNITAGDDKNVIVLAKLHENEKAPFDTTIGVQAVAGATAGDALVAITGAIVVYISKSETLSTVTDDVIIQGYGTGKVNNVYIYATNTSRITMRTVAFSDSSANITFALSTGVLTSTKKIKAIVGNNVQITAKNIEVEAIKYSVAAGLAREEFYINRHEDVIDYGYNSTTDKTLGIAGVTIKGLSESSLLKINTKKATEKDKTQSYYVVEAGIDKNKLTRMLESVFNLFSSVDYYIAIDSGSVASKSDLPSTSSGVGSIAGSVAVVVINNTINAEVGNNSKLNSDKDISVEAISSEESRVITGSVSMNEKTGTAAGTGASIVFVYENDDITAHIKDGAVLNCKDTLWVNAKNTGETEVYVVAASKSAQTSANIAATVNVVLSETKLTAKLGNPGSGSYHSAALARVLADNSKNIRNITLSLASASANAQVGGAVAVLVDESEAKVIADSTILHVTGACGTLDDKGNLIIPDSVIIKASNIHDLFVLVSSISVARVGSGANIAGIVSVIVDSSKAAVSAVGATITSNKLSTNTSYAGNIVIAAENESTLLNINLESSVGSAAVGVGAGVTVNILNRNTSVKLYDDKSPAFVTTVTAVNGDIRIKADANDNVVVIAAGASTAGGVSIQGSINVLVDSNTILINAKKLNATAEYAGLDYTKWGNITIASKFDGNIYGIVGAINFTKGAAAAGATILVLVNSNNIKTYIDDSKIISGNVATIESSATTKKLVISVGASVSAGGVAVQGSVVTVVASDIILVSLGKADVIAKELFVLSYADASENIISGSMAGSATVSVGPSVLVYVKSREISITSTPGGKIGSAAGCAADISAYAKDDIFTLVLAMSASGTAAVSAGICTVVIKNTVTCDVDADVNAGGHNISITAENHSTVRGYLFGGGFSGVASVVPIAAVIYTQGTTKADVSGNLTGSVISIKAISSLDLLEVAAGVSVAGTAGVNGTIAVVVNSATTQALFTGSHDGMGSEPVLNVIAKDTYTFNSVMIALGGGLAAGVGVNAAVTVAKNTVNATIGKDGADRKSVKADTVNVSAESVRNIKNIIGAGAFGVGAGVAVNIDVVVAGSKLPQDAVDMLSASRTADSSNESYALFNADSLINSIKSSNQYANNNGLLNSVTLASDTQGNGQRDSSIGKSSSEVKATPVDGSSLVSGLDSESTVEYTEDASTNTVKESDTLRGEDTVVDPSNLTKGNENLGDAVKYTYESGTNAEDYPKCTVSAFIRNTDIIADTVSVTAKDTINATVESVVLSASAGAAAGVGVTVVVLHSNVLAELASSAVVTCRQLTVDANSSSDKIFVLGGVMGAGTVGAAVATGVVHLDNVVLAKISGTVNPITNAGTGKLYRINVIAHSNYNNVSAATVSVAGGAVGVAASVAVVNVNGTADAFITGIINPLKSGSTILGGFDEVNVMVFLGNTISAKAASVGGGVVGVAMGVAVSSETLAANAAVSGTVELNGQSDKSNPALRILVAGSYDESTRTITQGVVSSTAQVAGGAAGLVATGASVAVSNVKPTIKTFISGTVKNSFNNLSVYVGNSIYTKSETNIASVTAGAASFGANVLLAFNTTLSDSYVSGKVDADNLSILALLSANAVSEMVNVSAAGLTMGVSTVISNLRAENKAYVADGADIKVRTLNISAGADSLSTDQKGAEFYSYAQLVAGSAGLLGLNVNVAAAYNNAKNIAMLVTNGTVRANTINVYAFGNPTASAQTKKAVASLANAGGSAAAGTLVYEQLVKIETGNISAYDDGKKANVNGGSYLCSGKTTDPQGNNVSKDYKQAQSSVEVYGVSVLGLNANVSIAKNKTKSEVLVKFAKPVGTVNLINETGANASAQIVEATLGAAAVGANVALSYVQAEFTTSLTANGVEGDVNLKTDYVSDSNSTVKAANRSLASLATNVLIAKSTTKAQTTFDGNGSNGAVTSSDRITVETIGESVVQAHSVKQMTVDVSAIAAANNTLVAVLNTKQYATMKNVVLAGSPTVYVTSTMNYYGRNAGYDAWARYEGTAPCEMNFSSSKANVLIANNKALNNAKAENISYSTGMAESFNVKALSHASAFADGGNKADNTGVSAALSSFGVIIAVASNNSENKAVIDNYHVPTKSLTVGAEMSDASAQSVGGVSSNGMLSKTNINVNVSNAVNNAKNEALLSNCYGASSSDKLNVDNVRVYGNAENVYASAYIGTAKVTLAGTSITGNIANALNKFIGDAQITGSNMTGSALAVESYENYRYYSKQIDYITRASVGSGGAGNDSMELTVISGSVNSATAKSISEVLAKISSSVLTGYNASVISDGRSDVKADMIGGGSIGLFKVSVINTSAVADGSVTAEFDPSDTKSSIKSLNIKAVGCATSESTTGSAGSLVSGITAGVNLSNASSKLAVNAKLSGGLLDVSGKADINSIGSANVKASADMPKFELSAVNVAVNKVTATSDITVETYVLPGTYNFGTLNAGSEIADAYDVKCTPAGSTDILFGKSTTDAVVQPSGVGNSSTKINLIGGSNHSATATSNHKVRTVIGSDTASSREGTINAGSASFKAYGTGYVNATANDDGITVGLITAGGSDCTATENDESEVIIGVKKLSAANGLSINSTNRLTADRNKEAAVIASSTKPGGFSAVDAASAESIAQVDMKSVIKIREGAELESTKGDINLNAYNEGSAQAYLTQAHQQGAIATIKKSSVPVTETLTTQIIFEKDSKATAGQKVSFTSSTNAKTVSEVDQKTSGAALDVNRMQGSSTVNGTNELKVGKNVLIKSDKSDISVLMTNSCDMRSKSDYACGFELIGSSKVTAANNFTAKNIIEMSDGSSIESANGGVDINQTNSGASMTAVSSSQGRDFGLHKDADATSINNIKSDNSLIYNIIKAAKDISTVQYGGAKAVNAESKGDVSAVGTTVKANSHNTAVINNTVTALSGGDMVTPQKAVIGQGSDNLGFDAYANPYGDGVLRCKVEADVYNNVTINNKCDGGTSGRDISKIAKNDIFVSDIDADGKMKVEFRTGKSGLIQYGTSSKNNYLTVTSSLADTYRLFKMYQNEFNPRSMDGNDSNKAVYNPSNLSRYNIRRIKNTDMISNPEYGTNAFVQMFKVQVIKKQMDLFSSIEYYFDEEGYLNITNAPFFAANLSDLDVAWLYEFLSAKNINIVVAKTDISLLYTSEDEFVKLFYSPDSIVFEGNQIIVTVEIDGVIHTYIIDNNNDTCEVYELVDGTKVNMSIIVVENGDSYTAYIVEEYINTKSAFVFFPEIPDDDNFVLRVKLKKDSIDGLYLREEETVAVA